MESLGAEPGPNLEMIFDASAQGSPVSISDWLPQVLCESRFEMDPFLGGRTFSFSAFCFFFVSFCLLGLPPHWIEKQPKMPEEKYDSIFFINPFLTSIYVFKDVKVKVIASQSRPTLYYPTD